MDSLPTRVETLYQLEDVSNKSPMVIKRDIEKVLNDLVETCDLNSFTLLENYLFQCEAGADKETVFELEICMIPYMDNVVGVRRKRVTGDALEYKELALLILSRANISNFFL